MKAKLAQLVVIVGILVSSISHAHAALIVFSDRAEFENAVQIRLSFEGFNDSDSRSSEIESIVGTNRYTSSKYLVSEGEKALYIKENNNLTITFGHEVFALGFDLNELNGSTFSFSDSSGRVFADLFTPTDDPFASTFFGFISDTPLTSFTLTSSGTASQYAYFAIDALSFSADPSSVYTPATFAVLVLGLCLLIWRRITRNPK